MRQRFIRAFGLAWVVTAAMPLVARAQAPAPTEPSAEAASDTVTRRIDGTLPRGRLIERLVSRADTGQRYALYLPSRYEPGRQWPVLFLLDPRGRALVPMRCFRAAAERHGYIVISSYNTLSDGALEPNQAAMDAMLDDVQRSLAVDSRRFYLVGFSGTARFAWAMSRQNPGLAAGIVGVGAAALGRAWVRANLGSSSPVLFGAVGTLDPNYEEVRAFDAELDSTRTPHRVEQFDGAHEWPPADVCARGTAWLELQAMRRGLVSPDRRWIDSLYADWHTAGERLEAAGDTPAAARQYRLVRADFDGLADVSALSARLAALARDPKVQRDARAEAEALESDRRRGRSLAAFVDEIKRASSPVSADQARRRLELDALRREAARGDDSASAIGARRALERIFAQMAFYVPREMFAARRHADAAAVLRVARLIKPEDVRACLDLARALAQTGDTANALQALECAARGRQVTATMVDGDSLLAPLRTDTRFQAIVAGLR